MIDFLAQDHDLVVRYQGGANAGHTVQVEFVSANPTGPMHVGHCRGAVVGDTLANLLAFAGYEVTKEYYINDAGSQIDVLAQSVYLRYREALGEDIGAIPEGLYPGEYLKPVGEALGSVAQPTLPPVPGPPVEGNVRSIATGRRGIEMLHGVEMEVTVELGRTRMAVRDLLALTPGAVLALDRAAGSPADLLVNGRLIARGEVVVVDEDFGLRITEILDQSAAV